MNKLHSILPVFLALTVISAPAQEEIILPDVTTTVTGENLTAGKDALPDFSDILPPLLEDKNILPQLPEASPVEIKDETVITEAEENTEAHEQSIYAEGIFEGGYPGMFNGNFSLYKSNSENPFKINFGHKEINGYGIHPASEGFYDSNTILTGEKQFTFSNMKLQLTGKYETEANGLQSTSNAFFNENRQTVSTSDSFSWEFGSKFLLNVSADAEFYSRYQGLLSDNESSDVTKKASGQTLYAEPKLDFTWNNLDEKEEGISVSLKALYSVENLLNDPPAVISAEASEGQTGTELNSAFFIQHGDFKLDGYWKNDFLKVQVNGGVVLFDEVNVIENSFTVLPQFEVSGILSGYTALSDRQFKASLNGGLFSGLSLYSELEKNYPEALLSFLPVETCDWFAGLNVYVPFADLLNVEVGADFKLTAFDKGVWEPDYTSKNALGMYDFVQLNRMELNSELKTGFVWNMINANVYWKAFWFHVPALETRHKIGLEFNLLPDTGKWGFTLSAEEYLGENADYMPVINASGFYKVNNMIHLGIEVNDAVKLITGTDRYYHDSEYICSSGSASLFVKFFF